jgi:diguanylate cyclase (GGDEF)-like protein
LKDGVQVLQGLAQWRGGLVRTALQLPVSVRVLLGVAALLQALFVVSLFLPFGRDFLVNAGLSILSGLATVATCWVAVILAPVRRLPAILATAGVTSYVLGNSLFIASTGVSGTTPFPSAADFAYLGFYVLMLIALVALARQRLRTHDRLVVFDAAIGALGAASVLALILTPVLDAAASGRTPFIVALSVAYPVLDVLLVAVLLAITTSDRSGAPWSFLVAGLLLFAAADVVYAMQAPDGAYVVGTALDAAWGVGLLLVVVWACQSTAPAPRPPARIAATRLGSAVTALAILGALAVLIFDPIVSGSVVATVLATITLAATAVPVVVRRKRLRHTQNYDTLTGLRNRQSFEHVVDDSLRSDAPASLFVLSVDDLDSVNEGLGHAAGDRLLVTLGGALRSAVPQDAEMARFGGNEFAVFVPGAGPDEHTQLISALRQRIEQPVLVGGIELRMSATVPTAACPENGRSCAALVQHAGAGQQDHTSRVRKRTDIAGALEDLEMLHSLRSPITPNQIVLEYQPQLRLSTHTIDRVEALVRWAHPTRGVLQPAQFLPLLESAGNLTAWTVEILRQAVHQAAEWNRNGRPLAVAVNVTGDALADLKFTDAILPLLNEHALPPQSLTLEITEQQLVDNPARAMLSLAPLRAAGVRIALDDFGTGYNSMSSLHEIDIDELKIDRRFITTLTTDTRSQTLVRSIIALAHDLHVETVAEGVEDEDTLRILARMDCTYAQGYLISRPVSPVNINRLR